MELVIGGASLAVIIILLMEALKKIGLNTKFIPILSLSLGIVGGIIASLTSDVVLVNGIVGGLLSGAAASGLFDNAKALLKSTVPIDEEVNKEV